MRPPERKGPNGADRRPPQQRTSDTAGPTLLERRPQGVVDPHAEALASDDDRQWFDEHRDRTHRFRRAHPGELCGEAQFILVRQHCPGFRQRLDVLSADGDLQELLTAPDYVLSIAFDLLLCGELVNLREVVAPAISPALCGGRA